MKYVVDAHALIWFFEGNSRIGPACKAAMDSADSELVLPATALAEACWAIYTGRTRLPDSVALLADIDADVRLSVVSLDRTIIERRLSLTAIREMHDRQIVATALLIAEAGESVALLTRDENITNSGLVPVVW